MKYQLLLLPWPLLPIQKLNEMTGQLNGKYMNKMAQNGRLLAN